MPYHHHRTHAHNTLPLNCVSYPPPTPVYCGPSVIPSPTLHPYISPVSHDTSPKQTSCLGRSSPQGRKQVSRGPQALSMWHMAARSSSLLLQPANTPERKWVVYFTAGQLIVTTGKKLLRIYCSKITTFPLFHLLKPSSNTNVWDRTSLKRSSK